MQESINFVDTFESLCEKQCTKEEILAIMDIDEVSLLLIAEQYYKRANFDYLIAKFQKRGRAKLRLQQFDMSKTHSTMAVWLGKQHLGQLNNPTSAGTSNDFSELDDDIFNDKCD